MPVYVNCFFNEIHYWLRLPLLYCPLSSYCAGKHPTVCNCLCSTYAACALGSIFFLCFQFCEIVCSTLCAVVALWILPSGIKKLPINPFLCFSRILRCICESGWHEEEWTPAVWYLQQGSECLMKPLLGITVIAHQGTLSFHYIKPFDRVILPGHF